MKSSQITHKSQQAFNKWMLPDEKQLNQGEEKIVAFEKKKKKGKVNHMDENHGSPFKPN